MLIQSVEDLARLEDGEREAILEELRASDPALAHVLNYWWAWWARPEQLMPGGDWFLWLICAGRGWGKTKVGAESIREIVTGAPGSLIALIGPTSSDCRDVMIEGPAGLLAAFPPEERPVYQPSKRRVNFRNGAVAFTYSAEEPERLRGPQHSGCWADEIAAYGENLKPVWDNLRFGLRIGARPRIIATTTPRPMRFLKELMQDVNTKVTRGSTFDNGAHLPESMLAELRRLYAGTTIGRQELEGVLLEDAEGALWKRARIDALRVSAAPELIRIVVAIDPSVTSGENSDECGIVAAGLGIDGHGYVLADRSAVLPPDQWAHRAVSVYDALGADRIIAETNNGGDLVEAVIRTVRNEISYEKVHASRGKVTRAEPIAALYEQGRVHHILGADLAALEEEMSNFVPGALSKSPNRTDALVWALTSLMVKPPVESRVW